MIRLFYNYYKDKHPARRREIDTCFQKNLNNKYINVVIIEKQEKPTYKYLFDQINKIVKPEDISIICNSDIYLDESISLAKIIAPNQVFALSRWDVDVTGQSTLFNRKDSQDTWIFKGPVRSVYSDFSLGIRGCDNRIAYELYQSGYSVSNPSLSIRTHHLHNSNIRNYIHQNAVPEPYMTVPVVTL